MLQNLRNVILRGIKQASELEERRGEIQLPPCGAAMVAMGVVYLPSQPGGSSLSGTWTGSPRRGRGGGRREARGVAKGVVMAG